MRRPGLKTARRVSQLAVLGLMLLLPELHARGWHLVTGNFFQFDLAGLPLADPLAAAQAVLASRALPGQLLFGGFAALVLAGLLGPVFCSWGCPFGLCSELVQGLRGQRADPGRTAGRPLRLRLALAGAGLALAGLFGLPPLINHLSLPGWFSRLIQPWDQAVAVTAALVLSAVLLGEFLAGGRFWCRFVCPQSALLGLAGRLSPWGLRVVFAPGRCACSREDRACRAACGLGIDPRLPGVRVADCTNCGDCVGACRGRGGALGFSLGSVSGERARRESRPGQITRE